ncbi:winged helix-turn-helix domain-containing protein [Dokdonella soli]|uniref:Winged helix-turn-helix domain-containing protein n=1 Tax=Dokdonella soli TaxID=529810 RepID=A0ABN1IP58_9GAMM
MNLHVSPQRATDTLLARSNLRLRIGEHVIDVGALRIVTRPDFPRLTSKAVAVLIELVRHAGATVTRDELLDRVWTGRFPTPDVLTQAIKELRRAFVDDSKPPRYIETIPKVGYRLIAPVLVLDGPADSIFVENASLRSLNDSEDPAADARDETESAASRQPVPLRAWKWVVPSLLLVAVGLAVAVLAGRTLQPGDSAAPTWHVSDVHALTSDPGSEYRPHLSPDGTRVAFSIFDPETHVERLVVRTVEPSQLVHLSSGGTTIEALPAWSPDGTRIAFERLGPNYCEIFVASSLGGDEREVGTCQDFNYSYFDWTPDGRSLISAERPDGGKGGLTLFTWNLDAGEKHGLRYERAADAQDLDPHYSPDGRWIAFRRGVAPYSDLYLMSSAGGSVRQVTRISARIFGFTWTADGRTLIYSSDYLGPAALYAVDVESGRTQALGIGPAEFPHAARSGDAVVYEIIRAQQKLTAMSLRADAAPSRVLAPSTGSDYAPVLSPSGDRIVFTSDRSGQMQLWLHDRSSGSTVQLTEDAEMPVMSANWSADGKHLVALQRNASNKRLIEIELSSHRQRVLSAPDENVMYGMYGVDPDSYLFAVHTSGRNSGLIQLDHPGTPQETRKIIIPGVAYAQVDEKTRSLYYTTSAADGLFRRDLGGGADHFITSGPTLGLMNGWRLVDGRVWYLADLGVRTMTLHEFDPANGKDRAVAKLGALLEDLSFSVTPNHDAIIFTPVDVEDTDVGMFRLARTSGR